MKKLNLVLLTLGCVLFIVSSATAQTRVKYQAKDAYQVKPVYQSAFTSTCDGKTDSPAECGPQGASSVDAGEDAIICSSQSYQLEGANPKNVKVLWKTSGDGTFDDPTSLKAVYTPGDYDKVIGEVILFLNVLPKAGFDVPSNSDSMILSIEFCGGVEDTNPEN